MADVAPKEENKLLALAQSDLEEDQEEEASQAGSQVGDEEEAGEDGGEEAEGQEGPGNSFGNGPEPEGNNESPKEAQEVKKGKKEKKEKKGKSFPIVKDSASFFKARRMAVTKFDFTPEGDIQVPEQKGNPPKVIKLPFYIPLTQDELRELDDDRYVKIDLIEEEYNELLKQLHEALSTWRETGKAKDVIRLQNELKTKDAERSALRYPVKWMTTFTNPTVRDILIDQKFEDRKMGFDITGLTFRSYKWNQLVKASDVPPVKKVEEEEQELPEEAPKQEEGPDYVIFYGAEDEENGFLSPDKEIKFIFNGSKFGSPLQAYEAERMTFLKRLDVRKKIMLQTGNIIRKTAATVVGQPENPVELWTKILHDLVSQHAPIREKLLESGDSILVYANPMDGNAGIGMAPNDPNVTVEEKWAGKNYLGQAWMTVRKMLKDGKIEEQEGGSFEEDGTTVLEEAAKAKKRGVLINRYRMSQN
jgi:predicted NAD-dependent protein-ADP-ribosyltransferase YbiA (DUF1768 family)